MQLKISAHLAELCYKKGENPKVVLFTHFPANEIRPQMSSMDSYAIDITLSPPSSMKYYNYCLMKVLPIYTSTVHTSQCYRAMPQRKETM